MRYLIALLACSLCTASAHAETVQYPAFWPASTAVPIYPDQLPTIHVTPHKKRPRYSVASIPGQKDAPGSAAKTKKSELADQMKWMGITFAASEAVPSIPVWADIIGTGRIFWARIEAAKKAGEPLWGPDKIIGNLVLSAADDLVGYTEMQNAPPKDRCWIFTKRAAIGHAGTALALFPPTAVASLFFIPVGFIPDKVMDKWRPKYDLCNPPH